MSVTVCLADYEKNGTFTRAQLAELLSDPGSDTLELLRMKADRIRRESVGDTVHIRGVIEFSNHCIRTCAYCGINRFNEKVNRYRIPIAEIKAVARGAANRGFHTVVLQSGDDFFYTAEDLADAVAEIKLTGMAVTLSVGERPQADYQLWRQAGADRYLLKFETSDPELYARLHPGTSLERRLECLRQLRELGYQVGSGFMVGLPGQTIDSLAGDLLLLRELELEMAGIGPFIPHPGTPLHVAETGSVPMTLRVLALARMMIPWAHLPATTALSSLSADGRRLGLTGGGNVVMPNLTPLAYRRLYEIYPHKAEVTATPDQLLAETKTLVHDLGRTIAQDAGHGRRLATAGA
ncbi:MAG: [FeFe] hydrogenase H-cluster radical SAM maturase HydE [Solirubrobacterales bacterium]